MIAELAYRRCGVVLASDGSDWEIEGVLNPGIARDRRGSLLMYPRLVAQGNVSRIGLVRGGSSEESTPFTRAGIVLEPQAEYELRSQPGGYGCEDARVTFVPALDAYIMAYTAFGPHGPRIALAISDDAHTWTRLGRVAFADDALNHVPNKDAAFFPGIVTSPAGVSSFAFYHRPMLPESVNGQAPISLVLSLPPARREVTSIAYVPVADALRDPNALCRPAESVRVLEVGESWGRFKNGCGTPPIAVENGWLSIFHGVDVREHADGVTSLYYRAGVVVHDRERPHEIRYRSPVPFLGPETPEERFGTVDDVVFPTGLDVLGDGRLDLYYGAADASICRAIVDVRLPAT